MLSKEIPFPCSPHAMSGNGIIKTLYQPYENSNQSSAIRRYPIDIKELEKLIEIWNQGCELLDSLLPKMPAGLISSTMTMIANTTVEEASG